MIVDRLTNLRTRLYEIRVEFHARRSRSVLYRRKLWRDWRLFYDQYSALLERLDQQRKQQYITDEVIK